MLALKRASSGPIAAALLWASFAVLAPEASAAPTVCSYSGGTLTVQLRGNNESFFAAPASSSGAEITVSAAGCSSPYDNVAILDIYGTAKVAEQVTFLAASNFNAATSWDEVSIRMTLGSGTGDEAVLDGTSGPDFIDAVYFAFTYSGVDTVTINGYGANDILVAMPTIHSEIFGEAGDDIIDGGAMGDLLDGGDNEDTIAGGEGDDFIHGGDDIAVDEMFGEEGNDTFYECGGITADDIIDGGSESDTVDYGDRTAPITVNLTTGFGGDFSSNEHDILTEIENAITGSAADTLIGNASDNVFDGGAGADTVDGGAGLDTIDYGSRTSDVIVVLPEVGATTTGNGETGENDSLTDVENVVGGDGSDTLSGSHGDNVIYGGAGGDNIDGFDGADSLFGDSESDDIHGDAGNDRIVGGTGADGVYGDAGNDNLDGTKDGSLDSIEGNDPVGGKADRCTVESTAERDWALANGCEVIVGLKKTRA